MNLLEYYQPIDNEEKINKIRDEILCFEANISTNIKKVRDHDHLTGKYRGASHSYCNLNYNNPSFLPVYVHNLSNYDDHLFIKELGYDKENIDVIPNNEVKYLSFSKSVKDGLQLRFLVIKFITSIAALSNNLKKVPIQRNFKALAKQIIRFSD